MDGLNNVPGFGPLDYAVFGLVLATSALIGIYFAFFSKKKQSSPEEYMLGSKEIGVFPIAMSLIATHFSGMEALGVPPEIYMYGTQVLVMVFLDVLMFLIMAYWLLPVFHGLKLTSMYEYLNKRFSTSVRTLGSIIFIAKMTLIIPLSVYAPALALAQVTGHPITVIIPTTCIICTFYTTIGGFRAVVWSNNLQLAILALGGVLIAIVGTAHVGGVATVIDINSKGQRLELFNMSWDPTIRHTFWNVLIGQSIYRLGYFAADQGTVQRCLASPSLNKFRISLVIFIFGMSMLLELSIYTGLVVYAAFHQCDPVTAQVLRKPDQLLPHFVMTVTKYIPAVPGIFLSSVFSGTLSIMSTGLNSISAVIYEDFIQPLHGTTRISEKRASLYLKLTTIIWGGFCTVLAFVADSLSGVIVQAAASFGGTTVGTLFGIFCLGMFVPWANTKGAIVGGLSAVSFVGWMAFGSQNAIYQKQIIYPTKPLSIAGCDNATLHSLTNTTSTLYNTTANLSPEEPFILYAISYTWYPVITLLIVLVVGSAVSCVTGPNRPRHLDRKLFSPAIKRFLPRDDCLDNRNIRIQTEDRGPASPLMKVNENC